MVIEAARKRRSFNTDFHRPSSSDTLEAPLRRGFLFWPQRRFDQLPSCFVDMLHNRIGTLLHFKIIIRTPRLTSAGMSDARSDGQRSLRLIIVADRASRTLTTSDALIPHHAS